MEFSHKPTKGFTIVELLIVIVVIGILASITFVAYNGVANNARKAAMQSNASQVTKQLFNYKTIQGSFPYSLSLLNNGQGPTTSLDAQFAYTQIADTFCLTVGSTGSSDTFYANVSDATPRSGACTGHTAVLSGYPSRLSSTDISTLYGSGDTIAASIESVPVGAWMIVVMTSYVTSDPIPPAGWTTLEARKQTNTLNTSIFAKIKQSSDANSQEFEAAGSNGNLYVNGALVWGENAAAVNTWTIGAFGDRASNATSTTALTPTVTVVTPKSLVLSIATERTNTDEVNYVSLVGASPWVWIPQPTGSLPKNQTIAIGYNQQASVGSSQAMTVTYPNAQATNATAVQVVIPPAS